MSCTGTLLRTIEQMDAELPGTVGSNDNSDTFIRVPGGWRNTEGFVTFDSEDMLKYWGPLTVTRRSPLDAHLQDPAGIALVDGINARKAGTQ